MSCYFTLITSLSILHSQYFTLNNTLSILHSQYFTPIPHSQYFTPNTSFSILHSQYFTLNTSLSILHSQYDTFGAVKSFSLVELYRRSGEPHCLGYYSNQLQLKERQQGSLKRRQTSTTFMGIISYHSNIRQCLDPSKPQYITVLSENQNTPLYFPLTLVLELNVARSMVLGIVVIMLVLW